ncbi:RecBCD enzyme subunit RecD [Achromobacter insuavis]|uniref:DEAD/DEAH box helicase n=1 Tax=Achromobacter insuavis TaxID=1287735 RepID=UPI001465427E|nr:AAA domain-containing protein [Achromobacter insuavis]CAB3910264.1 RecBCD enzyme subunit RecD [Achromobacter insuavis]
MKFQDLPADILTIRVKPTGDDVATLREQAVLSVDVDPSRPDEFAIRLKDALVFMRPVVATDIRLLNNELASGRTTLARLANPAADGSVELRIAFFTGACLEMGDIEVGVDEYVEHAMARLMPRKSELKGERLYSLLEQRCCLRHGDAVYFFLTAGPAIDEALAPENIAPAAQDGDDANQPGPAATDALPPTAPDAAARSQQVAPTRKNSFCLSGDGIRFVATQTALPHNKSIFVATRLTKARKRPDRALRLARGSLRFVDWTQAGQIQLLAKAQMTALTQDHGSYLRKWDEFGELEGERLLKQAREVGTLQFTDLEQQRDGTVSVHIAQASASGLTALAERRVPDIEIVDAPPAYLTDPTLRFAEFAKGVEKDEEYKTSPQQNGRREGTTNFGVAGFDSDSMRLTLKTETLPREAGILILSLAGEVAQIKRRMAARSAILEGRAANPQLGLLIEEKGKITPIRAAHKVPPLSGFVHNKVFENPPTEMQKAAIEVALNTPDIALIQGPPGTGKTTVIAAILERLNELADKRGATIKGQVLLTGFQHDAVENMIERLSLNGIPVPKFGKRSNAEEDDASLFEARLEAWCERLAADLRARNPRIAEIEQETEIKNLCLQYLQAPTRALAARLAGKIAALGIAVLGEETARRAAQVANKLTQDEKLNDDASQWLKLVRRLRTHPDSFADDGPERATDALDELSGVLNKPDRDLLDKASLWRSEDGDPPFLDDLAKLRHALLARFTAPPLFRVEKQNDEILALAEIATERIKAAGHSARNSKSAALAEFLAELESNPYGMIDAVSEYSFAFAATCQQSVNKRMQIQKGILGRDAEQRRKWIEYEYVIVDEAARVSPRDLMVPMAQGKRIILVGDHRQLPHIIDEEVAEQMEAGETGLQESEWLKKSMFQYLFSERLKTLEETDDFPRRVTLDKQYRMHRLLGDFISRNFYERFDPIEKFGSGRPDSDFMHELPDTQGRPAVWLNVPANKGKHQRSGTSWTRLVEATVIVRQLKSWMQSEAGKTLSFGVISFYKAQAEFIKEQLDTLRVDDKKLRVGTVDSFQGMEFDVVFLSMVRTWPQNQKADADTREQQARKVFGHLCLYNRLNVSMSRQKKMLVVVGDADLLHNDLAAEFVPGLVDFHKLCREEGVVLQC